MMRPIRYSIARIQTENEAGGGLFFNPDTMRFFRSQILPAVLDGPGGIYFITSEQNGTQARKYTVRRFYPATGRIRTAGSGEYTSLTARDARHAAEKLAALGEPV